MGDSWQSAGTTIHADKAEVHAENVHMGTDKSSFERVSLNDVQPPNYKPPPITEDLLKTLEEHQFLVLFPRGVQLDRLVRHIAFRWSEQLKAQGEPSLVVKEWLQEGSILRRLGTEERSILVLQGLMPHQLEMDLGKLQKVARKVGHIVVATTAVARSEWPIESNSRIGDCFREIDAAVLYPADFLMSCIESAVRALEPPYSLGLLPQGLPETGPLSKVPFVEDLTLAELCTALATPEQVEALFAWLERSERMATRESVLLYAEYLKGDPEALQRWYQQLDAQAQALVVAALLLEGVQDEQFFAVLDLLVAEVWRPRNPALASFDYRDLEQLSAYCNYVGSLREGFRLSWAFPEQREALLEIVFRQHRRQILAAWPALTQLIKESGTGNLESLLARPEVRELGTPPKASPQPPSDPRELSSTKLVEGAYASRWQEAGLARELYGDARRKNRFHLAMSDALSRCARRSFHALENLLFELARHPKIDVQAVAARALASWRELPGTEEEFFAKLEKWHYSCSEPETGQKNREPALGRAAVAVALAFALQYDPPGTPHVRLLKLFKLLANDRAPEVRDRFQRLALPFLVLWHLEGVEGLLREFTRSPELHEPLSQSLALAHTEDVRLVLDSWRKRAAEIPSADSERRTGDRENLLSVVALTYGWVELEPPGAGWSLDEIVKAFRELLDEPHPEVRKNVVLAILRQLINTFEAFSPQLQRLMKWVTLKERPLIVWVLVEKFKEQREALPGAAGRVEFLGEQVSYWRTARGFTSCELEMRKWLQDGSSPIGQQVALEALFRFVEFEWALSDHAGPAAGPRGSSQQPQRDEPAMTYHQLGPLDRLLVLAQTIFSATLRPTLRTAAAELAMLTRSNPKVARELVKRMTSWPEEEGRLGRLLRWFLRLRGS